MPFTVTLATVSVPLWYDELEGSVILRFVNVHSMNVNFKVEFGSSEGIMGSVLLLTDNSRLLWIADDSWGNQSAQHIDELKNEFSWCFAPILGAFFIFQLYYNK